MNQPNYSVLENSDRQSSLISRIDNLGDISKSIIKLGNNINPLGPSPKALKEIQNYLLSSHDINGNFSFYPEQYCSSLVFALKRKFKEIGNAEIIIGNGLNSLIQTITKVILKPGDKALIHTPTYPNFENAVHFAHGETVFFATTEEDGFKLKVDKFIKEITNEIKLVFLCNPNNPTGNLLTQEEIKRIILASQAVGAYVYLDEAYADYANESCIGKVKEYPNLIVGRTFSKAYGLAGLRIGWTVISKEILHLFRKKQSPFPVSILSIVAAEAALHDDEFIRQTLDNNKKGLAYFGKQLSKAGIKYLSSHTNFVSVFVGNEFNNKASDLCAWLLKKGVLIKNASGFRGAPLNIVTITVGRPEQNERVMNLLTSTVK